MSGSELAKAKELAAQKMREKQAAGMHRPVARFYSALPACDRNTHSLLTPLPADAKKAAEAAAAAGKK
jgi:hypothetical protein